MYFTSTLLLAFLLPTGNAADWADSNPSMHRVVRSRHTSPHARAVGNRSSSSFHLAKQKLDKRSQFTYYETGLGACGGYNSPGDFIVAMSAQDWDNGAHCNKEITITVNGKSAQATIVDECMGCPSGDLDFSEGLFSHLGDISEGVLGGSWTFGSGEITTSSTWEPETTTKTTKKHKTSTSSEWSSTSVWTPAPSSATPTSTSSSSSSSPTTTSQSSTSSSAESSSGVPSSTTMSSAAASASSAPEDTGVIPLLNLLLVQFGGIALAGQMASSS